MLNFFKINDPYRIVFIFLLVLAFRIPLFYLGVPEILPELKWMLIGEKLALGATMYKDLWDFTGPLAAGTYWIIHLIFGKSIIVYRLLSIVLVILQSFIFNNMLLKNKAMNQNSYVPALLYALFMQLSFDFFTLSPVLLGMTFALLGMNQLFRRMDNLTRDDLFVQMGVFMGIATLFYLPYLLFFIVNLIALLIYTGSIFRRMLLMFYGFLLVIALSCLHFFWFDSLSFYLQEYFLSVVSIKPYNYISTVGFLILVSFPIVLLLISFSKSRSLGRYVNYQLKLQNVMLIYLVVGVIAMIMSKEFSVFQVIFFIPGLAFFVSHYLIALREWLAAEGVFTVIFLLVLLNLLAPLKNWMYVDEFVSYENLIVQETNYDQLTEDKNLLVIGDDVNLYRNSTLSTPYLNWQFSKAHLKKLEFFDNLSHVFENFNNDLPEIIIDQRNVVTQLFAKMPTISLRYRRHPDIENVYLLEK